MDESFVRGPPRRGHVLSTSMPSPSLNATWAGPTGGGTTGRRAVRTPRDLERSRQHGTGAIDSVLDASTLARSMVSGAGSGATPVLVYGGTQNTIYVGSGAAPALTPAARQVQQLQQLQQSRSVFDVSSGSPVTSMPVASTSLMAPAQASVLGPGGLSDTSQAFTPLMQPFYKLGAVRAWATRPYVQMTESPLTLLDLDDESSEDGGDENGGAV